MRIRLALAIAAPGIVIMSALPALASSPPDAPVVSGSTTIGLDGTTITWSPPVSDGGSAITGYVAEYSRTSSFDAPESVTTDASATSVELTELAHSTTYVVHVAAQNSAGQSAWSPAIRINGLYPPGTPGIGSVDSRYRLIEIHFGPSSFPVSSTTFVASPGNHTCVAPAFSGFCALTDLAPGGRYTVSATSVNPAGSSTPATFSAVAVGSATTVGTLGAKVHVSANSTIALSWNAPGSLRYGTLVGVAYWITNNGPAEHDLKPWRTSLTINGVHRHTTYRVRIAALTRAPDDTIDILGGSRTITVKVP